METKQTAVEWLFKHLWDEPKNKMVWYAILEKAKAMEKDQLMNSYVAGAYEWSEYMDWGKDTKNPEEFYKETYGRTKK